MTNDDNRYSPPTAVVGDPVGEAPPARVRRAVTLMWISLALGVPSIVLSLARESSIDYPVITTILYALMFGFNALLNLKVALGRNWARITSFVLVVIGAYFLLVAPDETSSPGVAEWVINVVCMLLDGTAMVLLFTRPGSDWFRRRT